MTSSFSTTRTGRGETDETGATGETGRCRMPMGLDIVVSGTAPAELPGAGRPYPARRAHRLVARDSGEYLFVGIRGAADVRGAAGVRGGSGAHGPRQPEDVFLGPGDICFYDAHGPATLDFPERFRMKVFLVPYESLGLDAADVARLAGTPVPRVSRLGSLLSPFLSELADTASSSLPPVGELLAWNAVNVLATLATERLNRDATATPDARTPLRARILEFIDLHLTDEDLSPETIAGAHHISARYLHRLFQDEGTTVGRWIQRRRLEECRRDLMIRARGGRTIAAVANRWGFMSATHFSRVFRAAYGMSPSEWRDTVGRATPTGRR
ncbi:helix-turn-helix domain-containing protein [Streptomyces sp. NPDC056704]|uniref:helix-turn-helix domain-containing protein n=1 Tax=Streptomyces sp. NPDC056704 TaxID=3345917 RepID=UPI00368F7AE0